MVTVLLAGFQWKVRYSHAKIRAFPGAILKEFSHYVTPKLEDVKFNIAILHFGVNDLLQNRNRSKAMDELIFNLKKTATKYRKELAKL